MIIFLSLFEAVLPQARHALHSHAARPLVSPTPLRLYTFHTLRSCIILRPAHIV